jgi:ATP-dependent DNA helicase RecQ
VSSFAERLSEALGLPFVQVVNKVTQTAPQKQQDNSYHQSNNLDGAFDVVQEDLLEGPVLLVDDAVDSGWTLTIISALLLQAGSGPVFPLALTSTNLGS